MQEWPLLIFTVCLQAAIGGMFILAIFYKKISTLGEGKLFQVTKSSLIAIVGLSIVGLVASFTHLGTPTHAVNMISNLGTSWQSREILMTGLFIAAAVITLVLAFVQKKVNFVLVVISALIGLVDIYCMGAIYAATLVSGWDSIQTYTSFYGTGLVLGSVLLASTMVPALGKHDSGALTQSLVKSVFFISLAGIAIELIGLALFATSMPEVNVIAGTNALNSLDGYYGTVAFRWIIEVIGVVALGCLSMSKNSKLPLSLAYVALAALFVAEGMSRYVFYILGA
jgi:anaerobic dimethyl sulfoxide reductase subunit C (anchor subunit)